MPKVTAWQCPRTNKLFKQKRSYKEHLKKLARTNLNERYHQKVVQARQDLFRTMRSTCKNADEIEQFVKDNVASFWVNAAMSSAFDKKLADKMPEGFACKSFKITATHRDNVSNTHHAPMNGGVRNWDRKPDLPSGYPGFHGRVTFEFTHEMPGFTSGMFNGTGLETGSGGGGYRGGTYEIYLFDADWPALADRETTSRAEWNESYNSKKAVWDSARAAAKAVYDESYPAKREAYEKEMMEEVLRGKRQSVPDYDAQWQHRFTFNNFSHPEFKVTL